MIYVVIQIIWETSRIMKECLHEKPERLDVDYGI